MGGARVLNSSPSATGAANGAAAVEDAAVNKIALLFEAIPYYGHGDNPADERVRRVLRSLSPEDVAARDAYGNTILLLVCQYSCADLVPLVLSGAAVAGEPTQAGVNATNTAGACALHFPCYKDSLNPDTARLLVDAGATADVCEKSYGCTPLHYAAGAGNVALCRLLVGAGARPETCDFYNYTAVDYARQAEAPDCVQYLEALIASRVRHGAGSGDGGGSGGGGAAGVGTPVETVLRKAGGGGLVVSGGIGGNILPQFGRRDTGEFIVAAGLKFGSLQAQDAKLKGHRDSFDASSQNLLVVAKKKQREADSASTARQENKATTSAGDGRDGGSSGGGDAAPGFWQRLVDPTSGLAYHINDRTGESMWERELQDKVRALGNARLATAAMSRGNSGAGSLSSKGMIVAAVAATSANSGSGDGGSSVAAAAAAGAQGDSADGAWQWMRQHVFEARLVALLGRHDPLRLVEVQDLLRESNGREEALLARLRSAYGVEKEEPAMAALVAKLGGGGSGGGGSSGDGPSGGGGGGSSGDGGGGGGGSSSGGGGNSSSGGSKSAKKTPSLSATWSAGGPTVRPVIDVGDASSLSGGGGPQPTLSPTSSQLRLATGAPRRPGSAMPRTPARMPLAQKVSGQQLMRTTTASRMRAEHEAAARAAEAAGRHAAAVEEQRQRQRDETAEAEGRLARLTAAVAAATTAAGEAAAQVPALSAAVLEAEVEAAARVAVRNAAEAELMRNAKALEAELAAEKAKTAELRGQMGLLATNVDGAAAAARHEAEAKAAEEAARTAVCRDLVTSARLSVATTAEAARRRRGDEREALEKRLAGELAKLRADLAGVRERAAADLSRARSDAEAAVAAMAAAGVAAAEVAAQREEMAEQLADAARVVEWNVRLQAYIVRETERRKKLHNAIEDMKGKIRVYVRCRPTSTKEAERGCAEAVRRDGKTTVLVTDSKRSPPEERSFDFDQVFAGLPAGGNDQIDVFRDTSYLVTSSVDGYNVCIFAYGQTGSGKTYTMFGAGGAGAGIDPNTGAADRHAGVAPRAVSELFRVLQEREAQYAFEVSVSMFELYRDGLRDLLAKKNATQKLVIKLAEHSGTGLVVVEGGVVTPVNSVKELVGTMQEGAERRAVSSTQMNADSSRSHLVCSILLSSTNRRTGTAVRGKLTLVDLAGSERVGKSGASGDQLKEAQSINKSLSALGDVIAALTSGGKHVPYRNHPLTMLMSDSLGGNAKTLMFVCCSPADYNVSETVSSLQFAARCKDVTNAVAGGSGAEAAQVAALRRELDRLKKQGGPEAHKRPPQLGRPT